MNNHMQMHQVEHARRIKAAEDHRRVARARWENRQSNRILASLRRVLMRERQPVSSKSTQTQRRVRT